MGTNQVREVAEITPPADVANDLHVNPGETVIVRRRLVLLDGEPIELADSYFPAFIARGTALADQGKIRGGAVTLLAELGYTTASMLERISARPSTADERDLLNLNVTDWVLILRRVTRTADGTPFECSVMTMVADGRELQYELHGEG
ncbi:UTRA domain-containing protein [Nonomuraea sp. MTCD27]|uniref:UTRA domain-containing protein n=1 Tax=Nonomuraea sp. MTCD27 TaxID=1676747 RepID=UPI0035C070D1